MLKGESVFGFLSILLTTNELLIRQFPRAPVPNSYKIYRFHPVLSTQTRPLTTKWRSPRSHRVSPWPYGKIETRNVELDPWNYFPAAIWDFNWATSSRNLAAFSNSNLPAARFIFFSNCEIISTTFSVS